VIGLGLRLALNGGREAATRLAVTGAAVALGVGMLLVTLAGINAIKAQQARAAWLSTSASGSGPAGSGQARNPLLWLLRADRFGGQIIHRVDVAATGPRSPVPPGIPRLPGPGQYYASPALSRLLRITPAGQLRDRFPGRQAGTMGITALPAPNSLIIVIGHTAKELSLAPGTVRVTEITTSASAAAAASAGGAGTREAILAIAALALMFPVLTFVSTATRLSAARREQRFAAMRLVGATPRQVSAVSAVEASAAAVGGMAAGFGLFFLLRPLAARITFTGSPLFPCDLSLSLSDVLLAAVGIPLLAAVVARLALRRVQISPLGVSRRVTPSAPRAWRVIPLLAGLAELAYFAVVGHPKSTQGQTDAFFPGFLLLVVGLVIAGPWVTMAVSRVIARHARRPAALIAGRRLSDAPGTAFRAVGGLIIALFITSVAAGVITTLVADQGAPPGGAVVTDTLVDQFVGGPTASGGKVESAAIISAQVLAGLNAIRGVTGVTVIHADPFAARGASPDTGVVSCAQLATTPALGSCAAPAGVAAITSSISRSALLGNSRIAFTGRLWPAAAVSPARLGTLPDRAIVVATNGSRAAIEQARTALEIAAPFLGRPLTAGEANNEARAQVTEWQREADVVILASLPIAGCSLAVSVAVGLIDRKRPFSLLRLTGAPLATLRRVVALESAGPLAAVALISVASGLLGADLFLQSQFGVPLRSPGAAYYASVLGGSSRRSPSSRPRSRC
jgi:hypothetical protein